MPKRPSRVSQEYRDLTHAFRFGGALALASDIVHRNPTVVREVDGDGLLALHRACLRNFYFVPVESFQLLVEAYPESIRRQDNYGRTPLHYLACNFGVSIVAIHYLVELAPETVVARDINKRTPLDEAKEVRCYSTTQKRAKQQVISYLDQVTCRVQTERMERLRRLIVEDDNKTLDVSLHRKLILHAFSNPVVCDDPSVMFNLVSNKHQLLLERLGEEKKKQVAATGKFLAEHVGRSKANKNSTWRTCIKKRKIG